MKDEVSIIINGIQYDAVDGKGYTNCDLLEYCTSELYQCNMFAEKMSLFKIFKKSDRILNHEKE